MRIVRVRIAVWESGIDLVFSVKLFHPLQLLHLRVTLPRIPGDMAQDHAEVYALRT